MVFESTVSMRSRYILERSASTPALATMAEGAMRAARATSPLCACLDRRQHSELDILCRIRQLGNHRGIRRSHYPRVTSATRPQLDAFSSPTGHCLVNGDHEQAHRTAMPGTQIRNIGGPDVRLVPVARQLHLNDDTKDLIWPTRQKQHQVGSIFSRPKVAQLRRLNAHRIELREFAHRSGAATPRLIPSGCGTGG